MNQAAIITNGIFPENFLPEIANEKFVIGVDRAGFLLAKKGVIPNLVLGDMDSVSAKELCEIERNGIMIKRFKKEKNNTDTELAVMETVSRGYKRAVVYGVVGTRFDHLLSSVLLLEKYSHQIQLIIKDDKNEMQLINDQQMIKKSENYNFISFISLTDFSVLSLIGFKFPLTKKKIYRGDSLCISNELKTIGEVKVWRGKVLCIRSSD